MRPVARLALVPVLFLACAGPSEPADDFDDDGLFEGELRPAVPCDDEAGFTSICGGSQPVAVASIRAGSNATASGDVAQTFTGAAGFPERLDLGARLLRGLGASAAVLHVELRSASGPDATSFGAIVASGEVSVDPSWRSGAALQIALSPPGGGSPTALLPGDTYAFVVTVTRPSTGSVLVGLASHPSDSWSGGHALRAARRGSAAAQFRALAGDLSFRLLLSCATDCGGDTPTGTVATVNGEQCFDLDAGAAVSPGGGPGGQCGTDGDLVFAVGGPNVVTFWNEQYADAAIVEKPFNLVTSDDVGAAVFCDYVNDPACDGAPLDPGYRIGEPGFTVLVRSGTSTIFKVGWLAYDSGSNQVTFQYEVLPAAPPPSGTVATVGGEQCFDLDAGSPVAQGGPGSQCGFDGDLVWAVAGPEVAPFWNEQYADAAIVEKPFGQVTSADLAGAVFCDYINAPACGGAPLDPGYRRGAPGFTVLVRTGTSTVFKVGWLAFDTGTNEVTFQYAPLP